MVRFLLKQILKANKYSKMLSQNCISRSVIYFHLLGCTVSLLSIPLINNLFFFHLKKSSVMKTQKVVSTDFLIYIFVILPNNHREVEDFTTDLLDL